MEYDFLVDNGKRIIRVQIKSTQYRTGNCYRLDVARGSRKSYTSGSIDFIAGYVIPENAWYIMPADQMAPYQVALYPHNPEAQGRLERYRDAWHLLDA